MATVTERQRTETPAGNGIPQLQNGDRLTRAEFERRYAAMPPTKKAELIEGVVYMSSLVSQAHSGSHFDLIWVQLLFLQSGSGHNGSHFQDLRGADGSMRIDSWSRGSH